MIHPGARVFRQVNRKCSPKNMILQLSIPYSDPEPQTPHRQNFQISLTMACGYTVCHTAKMSEQANRKSIVASMMAQPSAPTPFLSPQAAYTQNLNV